MRQCTHVYAECGEQNDNSLGLHNIKLPTSAKADIETFAEQHVGRGNFVT